MTRDLPESPHSAEFRPDPRFLAAHIGRIKRYIAPPPALWLGLGIVAFLTGIVMVIAKQPIIGWSLAGVSIVPIIVGARRGSHPVWNQSRLALAGVRSIKWHTHEWWEAEAFTLLQPRRSLDRPRFIEDLVLEIREDPDKWGHFTVIHEVMDLTIEGDEAWLPDGCDPDDLTLLPVLITFERVDDSSGGIRARAWHWTS